MTVDKGYILKTIEILENDNNRDKLSKNCRHIAETEYSIELQAQRYIELYRQILSQNNTES
jgi:glycosyltransferase involved in cell wall biosynthesis